MIVSLPEAAALLDQGQVVAIPTETVYGLAADAANDDALTRLYRTKGRPVDHPVILHVCDLKMLERYVTEVPAYALALVEAFWPGPLTLLLPRNTRVSDRITGGRPLVGVRAPATPLTQELLKTLGRPLVAPSANRFGHISPTSAQHVEEEFDGMVAVLDGGPCQVGLESTIVRVESDQIVVLRPGQISAPELQEVVGVPVVHPQAASIEGVPGALKSHYAPRQPLKLLEADELVGLSGKRAAILAITPGLWPDAVHLEIMPADPNEYAKCLYRALRQAEASDCSQILVERPPLDERWRAARDRLERAAARV